MLRAEVMRPSSTLLVLFALVAACDGTTSTTPLDAARDTLDAASDAPSNDALTDGPTDGPSEASTDAPADVGPPPPHTCGTCLYDSECGPGGHCVPFDPTNQPGVRQCLVACFERGAACAASVPSTCREDEATGDLVCTPNESCAPMTSRRAQPCPADGCTGRYSVCADITHADAVHGRTGVVCLPPCERDADCEDGLRRCMTIRSREGAPVRACVPDDRFGPDACGLKPVNARGIGATCDATTACPASLECATDIDPALTRGFCTASCAGDPECGAGARCLSLGARGMRCVPEDCACAAGSRGALLDRALAQAAPPWTRCNLYFTIPNLDAFPLNVSRDRFRLPVFDRIHRDWLAGVRWSREMGPALDAASTTLSGSLAAMASLRADGTATSITAPDAVAAPSDALTALLDGLVATGATIDRARASQAMSSWPPALVSALSRVLSASLDAARARDRGLPFATTPDERQRLFDIGPHMFLPAVRATERPDFAQAFDLGSLLGDVTVPVPEALRLARTIESINWVPLRGVMGPTLNLDTPMGAVIVRDAAPHRYTATDQDRTLVVIDLGGDDTYENPIAANADPDNPVSVLVDLGGDDTYAYPQVDSPLDRPETLPSDRDGRARAGATATPSVSNVGRQGSARLGVALLYDLGGGADRYRSLRMSQGFASFGVGGLYDDGGSDEYVVEAGSQGAAVAGVAALVDAGGDDRYSAWAFAEGFAYVRGAAVLYDRDGADVYDSKLTPVLYGSPQDATVNSSFTQGAGFGRRGDGAPDRTNMSGGLGVLRDRAGNDRYSSAIFGTATGYWGGMGLLLDGAGDDRYDGRWYSQGGAAHFAYAALVDGGGRDVHNMTATRQNMTAGAGHDFSLGILLSLGRDDDVYGVPNLALGAGNANGTGIFADEGGADTYEAASELTLGNAALETLTDPGRLMRSTVGIFLDGDGTDIYRRPTVMSPPEGNDRVWNQRTHTEAPLERGFGADATGATLGL